MPELNRKSYLITSLIFWIWTVAFLVCYISSGGFRDYMKYKLIPWVKEAKGIVRGDPEVIYGLNRHARLAVINIKTEPAVTEAMRKRYFGKWDPEYLAFTNRAVKNVLNKEKHNQKPINVSFAELHTQGKLKIEGAEAEVRESKLILSETGGSCRVDISFSEAFSGYVYDILTLKGGFDSGKEKESFFSQYVRIFLRTRRWPVYSGERSFPINLSGWNEEHEIRKDLFRDYSWRDKDITGLLLIFYVSENSRLILEDLTLEISRDNENI